MIPVTSSHETAPTVTLRRPSLPISGKRAIRAASGAYGNETLVLLRSLLFYSILQTSAFSFLPAGPNRPAGLFTEQTVRRGGKKSALRACGAGKIGEVIASMPLKGFVGLLSDLDHQEGHATGVTQRQLPLMSSSGRRGLQRWGEVKAVPGTDAYAPSRRLSNHS